MRRPTKVTPAAWRILERLSRYRFLNVPQLLAAGAGDEKTVRTRLRELVQSEMIGVQPFSLGTGIGKLPSQYWLTASGAKLLESATGELPSFPVNPVLSPNHLTHRVITTNAMIAADRWAAETGQELPELRTYMVKTGPDTWASSIPALKRHADAILQLTGADGRHRTYVVEVYYDRSGKSATPAQKIEPYVLLGMVDEFDDALGIGKNEPAAKVLVICDTHQMRDRLVRSLPERQGMPDRAAETWGRFRFKAADELGDFGSGWLTVDGQVVSLSTGQA